MSVFADSEVGRLRAVLTHRPGLEIEAMTPRTARSVLYNDIVPLREVAREHDALTRVLSRFAAVYELTELLEEALAQPSAAAEAIRIVGDLYRLGDRVSRLIDLDGTELTRALVGGVRTDRNTLAGRLSLDEFDVPPLPNLYFSRDGGFVYRDGVVIASMANTVRTLEARLLGLICAYHPLFADAPVLFSRDSEPGLTIEGGDVLLWRPDLLLIGISERTTPAGIDAVAASMARHAGHEISVIACLLPETRSTIHLDMLVCAVDHSALLVYPPVLDGDCFHGVLRLDVDPAGRSCVRRVPDLFSELSEQGEEIEVIPCGGEEPVAQQREQWFSGANFLTVAPGVIVGYDLNPRTLEALDLHGFEITPADDFLGGAHPGRDGRRQAIVVPGSNLARGGGGVRCMTMPIERDPVHSSERITRSTTC